MLFCFFVGLNQTISYTKPFLYSYLVLALGGLYIQFNFNQADISSIINGLHHPMLDILCKYGTHLGDGITFVLICVLLFFYNRKLAITFLVAYLFSSLLAQGFKHLVFSESLRPSMVLDTTKLHLVDGVQLIRFNSFPSGHTTSAFALFGLFSFYLTGNKLYQIMLIVPALFVAFTRIYLLQHFFEDTLFGSILGVLSAVLVYQISNRIKPENKAHE